MKTFCSDTFKNEAEMLKYDVAIKEIFGNDVILTYSYKKRFSSTTREDAITKKFSMTPLWYLQFLTSTNPTKIVDIGCGGNLFKPVIQKIFNIPCHGIDPDPNNRAADEFDYFDLDFSQGHTEAYQCVFSINALHFIPLYNFATRVNEFHNIVASGGRGFLAFNAIRMIELTPSHWLLNMFETTSPTLLQIEDYVRQQLSTLSIDFMVIDLLITEFPEESMDGNIRMVFKK